MNILVTGGAGFIASHIVDAYLKLGHRVTIVDNLSTGRRENINPDAQFVSMDIRDPRMDELFRQERFDALCHHAAQIDVRRSVEDPSHDASVNILGGIALYALCAVYGVQKVVFASTGGAIYGEQIAFPADESHPTEPSSPYGIAKLANEKYLAFFGAHHGFVPVCLRYTNVYGPRQNPHGEAGVVAIFLNTMLEGGQPVINGDGLQTRDYVFVEDVVRANVLALTHPHADILNVCTGVETSVNDIFRTLHTSAGRTLEEHHAPAKPGEQFRSVCTYEKAKRVLGWEPSVSIQTGLKRTAEWFMNSGR
jgi:UDP-glucose 4-epimerase